MRVDHETGLIVLLSVPRLDKSNILQKVAECDRTSKKERLIVQLQYSHLPAFARFAQFNCDAPDDGYILVTAEEPHQTLLQEAILA